MRYSKVDMTRTVEDATTRPWTEDRTTTHNALQSLPMIADDADTQVVVMANTQLDRGRQRGDDRAETRHDWPSLHPGVGIRPMSMSCSLVWTRPTRVRQLLSTHHTTRLSPSLDSRRACEKATAAASFWHCAPTLLAPLHQATVHYPPTT